MKYRDSLRDKAWRAIKDHISSSAFHTGLATVRRVEISKDGLDEEQTDHVKEIEKRLCMLEKLMATANPKDLPALNATYQKLMDKLVTSDVEAITNKEN